MKFLPVVLLAGLPLAACANVGGNSSPPPTYSAPAYGSTADIASFQGAKAGQAEGGLNAKGYQLARTQGLTAFWWNQATQTCARIVTADGRYQTVAPAARSDCGR
jgi:hypothetical protein